MDNNLSGLDPKLKETYERVMGTSVAGPNSNPQTPTVPTQTPPTQTSQPSVVRPTLQESPTIPATPKPQTPQQRTQPQAPKDETLESTVHYQAFTQPNAAGEKKKSGLSPVILALGGVVFFIVYALVWIKIFNVKLPFLP